MRVEQFLSDSATRFGAKAAIIACGRPYSYVELARASDRVAAALTSRGIGRGQRVALFMDDNFEAVVAAFAVLKAGAVAAAVEPDAEVGAVVAALAAAQPSALITEAKLASVAARAMARVSGVRLVLLRGGDRSTAGENCMVFEEVARGIGPVSPLTRAGPASDPAMLLAVNRPDGTMPASISHTQVVAAAATFPTGRGSRTLSSVLTYHGVCQLLAAIRVGATLVLEKSSRLGNVDFSEADGDVVPALAGQGSVQ